MESVDNVVIGLVDILLMCIIIVEVVVKMWKYFCGL